ncbi:unnamed protein product, partial [Staurois parvus]
MVLGRKGLTSGGIQRVNCVLGVFYYGAVRVLHCKHTALHSHSKQCAGARISDGEEDCFVYSL